MNQRMEVPNSQRVAQRLYVLLGVATRALLENDIPPDQAEVARKQILKWLTAIGVEHEIESVEHEILSTPVGGVSKQQIINAIWRFEGVSVLAWALSLFDKGADDTLVNPPDITGALKLLSPEAKSIIASANLRDPETLKKYFDQIFSIHWRLVDYRVNPVKKDFFGIVERTNFGLTTAGLSFADGDLAFVGRPLFSYDLNEVGIFTSIASERHTAMEWLFGQESNYHDVRPHT